MQHDAIHQHLIDATIIIACAVYHHKDKRKFEAEQRQLQKIKEALFPKNNLQERVENIAVLYSKYGKEIIDVLLDNSLTTEQAFTMVEPAQNAE